KDKRLSTRAFLVCASIILAIGIIYDNNRIIENDEAPVPGDLKGVGPPPRGAFCQVRGRALFLLRSGTGAPAIVFLSGAGTVGLEYFNVHERAGRLTTSLVYDRGGTGWSEGKARDRSGAALSDELRALLSAAEIPPPYVLVGHSFGGLIARVFAQRFPAET